MARWPIALAVVGAFLAPQSTAAEQPPTPLQSATTHGFGAFREVCLAKLGDLSGMERAAEAKGFRRLPQAAGSTNLPEGFLWGASHAGHQIGLQMSENAHECSLILFRADTGLVLLGMLALPMAFEGPNAEVVRMTPRTEQERIVAMFRVTTLPRELENADRLVTVEANPSSDGSSRAMLSIKTVKQEPAA